LEVQLVVRAWARHPASDSVMAPAAVMEPATVHPASASVMEPATVV